jgi:hypothetical protein
MSASLADLISSYNAIRDEYRADPDSKNDEDGAKWIAAYYAVIDYQCASPADAITKCQFVAKAMDGKEMGFFEEEEVIHQIAALADLPHPDAKLIELGRQFEAAKTKARKLDPIRTGAFAKYEGAKASAGIPDTPRDQSESQRTLERKLYRDTGYKAASDAFNAAHGESIRLMEAIHRAKASTLEGFAIKVAAIAFDQADFDINAPVPTDVAERMLYRLAHDMAKVVKAGGSPCA